MGGGGGSGARNVGSLAGLVEAAKQALSSERKNVFISFAYEDIDEVNLLRGQSKNDLLEIAFNDWSVSEPFNSKNSDYIQERITDRINQCSTTVVYVSDSTAASEWVDWEVRKSLELGKRIVAVHAGTTRPTQIPKCVTDNGIRVVPWSELARELKKP